MMRFICRFVVFVCGLGAWCALGAQTPAPPPRPAILRFLFLEDRPAAYFVRIGRDEYKQISSSPYAISAPFVPAGLEPVGIYRYEVIAPAPASTQTGAAPSPYVKVASVTPSTTTTSTLVVLVPQPPAAPAMTSGLRAVEYDTDAAEFPAGSIRVINLGRATMAVRFGSTTPVQVEAGSASVIRPVPDAQHRVPTRIAVQEPAGWRVLSNKILMLRPTQRITGVFIYSPSGMRHTYTREEIVEFGPPKPGHAWLTFTDIPPPVPAATN